MTVEELLKGKPTVIKGKEYLSTEAYVTPFLERMSKYTNNFIVQAKMPDQLSITDNGDEDVIYNRVYIQAVLPDSLVYENHSEVIGLVYGLDTRKPIYKIFRSGLNMACTNLCVFSPTFINTFELEPEKPMNFRCIQPLMEQVSNIKVMLDKMKNIEVPYNDNIINDNLGKWVRNSIYMSHDTGYGKVKLATTTAIDAYKLVYDKEDSPYYIKEGETTDMFNIYNAFTELICNSDTRDIMNKAEKTLLLTNILGI